MKFRHVFFGQQIPQQYQRQVDIVARVETKRKEKKKGKR